MYHLHGIVYLVVEEEGVDGYKYLGTIEMCVLNEGFDVLEGIGGGSAGAEGRGSDV